MAAPISASEHDLLVSMAECLRRHDEIRRRERRIANRLRRRALRLTRQSGGYCITDRDTSLCEAFGLTLDQAEAWAMKHVTGRTAA